MNVACEVCDSCNELAVQSNVRIVETEPRSYLKSQFDYLYTTIRSYLKVIYEKLCGKSTEEQNFDTEECTDEFVEKVEETIAATEENVENAEKAEEQKEATRKRAAEETSQQKKAGEERSKKAEKEQAERKNAKKEKETAKNSDSKEDGDEDKTDGGK